MVNLSEENCDGVTIAAMLNETACPRCTRPFVRAFKKPLCQFCTQERRKDYAKAMRGNSFIAYNEKWDRSLWPKKDGHPVRALLDGAVEISGKIFFFNGVPYVAARFREELKSLL